MTDDEERDDREENINWDKLIDSDIEDILKEFGIIDSEEATDKDIEDALKDIMDETDFEPTKTYRGSSQEEVDSALEDVEVETGLGGRINDTQYTGFLGLPIDQPEQLIDKIAEINKLNDRVGRGTLAIEFIEGITDSEAESLFIYSDERDVNLYVSRGSDLGTDEIRQIRSEGQNSFNGRKDRIVPGRNISYHGLMENIFIAQSTVYDGISEYINEFADQVEEIGSGTDSDREIEEKIAEMTPQVRGLISALYDEDRLTGRETGFDEYWNSWIEENDYSAEQAEKMSIVADFLEHEIEQTADEMEKSYSPARIPEELKDIYSDLSSNQNHQNIQRPVYTVFASDKTVQDQKFEKYIKRNAEIWSRLNGLASLATKNLSADVSYLFQDDLDRV